MKKILALVLAFVLVLVPMTMSVSAADGDDAATLTVGTSAEVAAEDPIAIAVSVATEAQDGIAGAQFDIALGDLVYVSTTADAESVVYVEETNTVKFVDASLDGMGDLFTINVTVPADAEAEDTFTPVVSNVVLCKENEELFAVTSNVATYTVPSQQAAATLDTELVFRGVNVAIGDTLMLSCMVNKPVYTKYSSMKLVAVMTKYDVSLNKYVADPVEIAFDETYLNTANLEFASASATGIGMYEMGLPVDVYLNAYDAGGNKVAYSETTTVIPANLLKELYNSNLANADKNKATAVKTCTIVTDLLNMSAEAQKYFRKEGTDLNNEALVNAGFSQKYASKALPTTMNSVNNTVWHNTTVLSKTKNTLSTLVALGAAPSVSYVIRDNTAAPLDPSKLSLKVSYTSASGATLEDTYTGDDFGVTLVNEVPFVYSVYFGKTCLYDSNKTVTAVLTYDGTKIWTNTYSVETYIKANKDNASTGAVLTAVGKFGASCRAYFGYT